MTIDYYLQTADEPTMRAALIEAGVATWELAEIDAEGNVTAQHALVPAAGVLIDVIGTWFERTGGTDNEPVMTQLPGWHVNVRSAEPVEWPDSVTLAQPKTPWRVWG
jgi:hypothetical protein